MRYDCIQDEFSSCESGQEDAPIGQPQRSESGTGPDRPVVQDATASDSDMQPGGTLERIVRLA